MLHQYQTPICGGLETKNGVFKMDNITKSIIFDLVKAGNPIEMIGFELGVSSQDIKNALREIDQTRISNILAEQLASRLPALLEFSFIQLEKIILNDNTDRKLRAINTVVQAATTLSKLKHN
jgi:hypothetical protein